MHQDLKACYFDLKSPLISTIVSISCCYLVMFAIFCFFFGLFDAVFRRPKMTEETCSIILASNEPMKRRLEFYSVFSFNLKLTAAVAQLVKRLLPTPRFKSSYWQTLYYLFNVNCTKKTKNKEKKCWEWPNFLKNLQKL